MFGENRLTELPTDTKTETAIYYFWFAKGLFSIWHEARNVAPLQVLKEKVKCW